MGVNIDDALTRKVAMRQEGDSPGSIDLTAEEVLKSPKDVLALGRVIVRELELAARGTVLQRWMAHHLAETLAEADSAEEEAKVDAEARAVKLILELWRHRRALPDTVDPLEGIRDTVNILSRMAPESNPWRYARGQGGKRSSPRDIRRPRQGGRAWCQLARSPT